MILQNHQMALDTAALAVVDAEVAVFVNQIHHVVDLNGCCSGNAGRRMDASRSSGYEAIYFRNCQVRTR